MPRVTSWIGRWLTPASDPRTGHVVSRWLFLRALGLIFFSAFYSYLDQIQGLIGPQGILPADHYLAYVRDHLGISRFWFVPTVLWINSGASALHLLCWIGILASIALALNLQPRASLLLCLVAFLSFISTSQDFSSYQSDGMLLEAAFINLFLVPGGWRPGLAKWNPPIRAGVFLLQWEWFRIYFESGVVKLLSGDTHWRHLTAMDDYYQNGPLPTWIGWYAQMKLPHLVHQATTLLTLVVELGVVWMLFLNRRCRLVCFIFLIFFQTGIILTANYAFLNYIVLALSVFLVDDGYWEKLIVKAKAILPLPDLRESSDGKVSSSQGNPVSQWISAIFLGWVFYATTARLLLIVSRNLPLPIAPIEALEPFRFANQYGLFAVMTPARYEIEFQGSIDGKNWQAYLFRYKPQAIDKAPGIYAPYQPRFEWNLWFASLGSWQDYPWVTQTEARLLQGSPSVLELFRANPFHDAAPAFVRAIVWQYWFSDPESHRRSGVWWRREERGLYAPELQRSLDGKIQVVEYPPARAGL